MTTARTIILAFATAVGLATLAAPQPASATDWSFLNNKPYMDCLKLFHYGDFMMPRGLSPAEIAARKEKGRRYCNRTYGYGN